MDYYIIYDKNDNLIAYCENLDELSEFVNRRKKELKYRLKNKNRYYIQIPNLLKIYKFSWKKLSEVVPRFFVCYFNYKKGECEYEWSRIHIKGHN